MAVPNPNTDILKDPRVTRKQPFESSVSIKNLLISFILQRWADIRRPYRQIPLVDYTSTPIAVLMEDYANVLTQHRDFELINMRFICSFGRVNTEAKAESLFYDMIKAYFLPGNSRVIPPDDRIMMVFLMTSNLSFESRGNPKCRAELFANWATKCLQSFNYISTNTLALQNRWLRNYNKIIHPSRKFDLCELDALHSKKGQMVQTPTKFRLNKPVASQQAAPSSASQSTENTDAAAAVNLKAALGEKKCVDCSKLGHCEKVAISFVFTGLRGSNLSRDQMDCLQHLFPKWQSVSSEKCLAALQKYTNMIVYKVSGYREVLGRLIELLTKSKRRPSFPDLLERHVLGDDGWKDTDKVMMILTLAANFVSNSLLRNQPTEAFDFLSSAYKLLTKTKEKASQTERVLMYIEKNIDAILEKKVYHIVADTKLVGDLDPPLGHVIPDLVSEPTQTEEMELDDDAAYQDELAADENLPGNYEQEVLPQKAEPIKKKFTLQPAPPAAKKPDSTSYVFVRLLENAKSKASKTTESRGLVDANKEYQVLIEEPESIYDKAWSKKEIVKLRAKRTDIIYEQEDQAKIPDTPQPPPAPAKKPVTDDTQERLFTELVDYLDSELSSANTPKSPAKPAKKTAAKDTEQDSFTDLYNFLANELSSTSPPENQAKPAKKTAAKDTEQDSFTELYKSLANELSSSEVPTESDPAESTQDTEQDAASNQVDPQDPLTSLLIEMQDYTFEPIDDSAPSEAIDVPATKVKPTKNVPKPAKRSANEPNQQIPKRKQPPATYQASATLSAAAKMAAAAKTAENDISKFVEFMDSLEEPTQFDSPAASPAKSAKYDTVNPPPSSATQGIPHTIISSENQPDEQDLLLQQLELIQPNTVQYTTAYLPDTDVALPQADNVHQSVGLRGQTDEEEMLLLELENTETTDSNDDVDDFFQFF